MCLFPTISRKSKQKAGGIGFLSPIVPHLSCLVLVFGLKQKLGAFYVGGMYYEVAGS